MTSSISKLFKIHINVSYGDHRPYSAPAIPPEGDSVDQTDQASPRLVKTYTTDSVSLLQWQ